MYKIIILLEVLCGCKPWSPTLREEHRLRIFENRVLRIIFGLQRDNITEGWKKMHDEKLHSLYFLQKTIKIILYTTVGWVWYAEHTGEKMSACKIFGMKT
jgi:hypothetical protein